MRTSDKLVVGNTYTRTELSDLFAIKDATIKNGIFRPKDHHSIWLFVTEEKTSDRAPYVDSLHGNDLFVDGQNAGRTDAMVMQHEAQGLEIILFYGKRRNEFPNFAFRYEGKFRYRDHRGTRPAHFHLQRTD